MGLRIIISLILLVFLVYKIDHKAVLKIITIFPIEAILLIALAYIVGIFLSSLALFVIIKDYIPIKFFGFLKLNWFALSIGQFSPARIGEASIVYILNKKFDTPAGPIMGGFLVHKFSIFVTFILFSLIMFPFFTFLLEWYFFLILFIVLIIPIPFIIGNRKARNLIQKHILRKHASTFRGLYGKLVSMKNKKGLLFLVLLINASKLGYSALTVKIILLLFGINVPILIVMGITSIGLLASFIPISFSGIGIKESTMTFLFYFLGFSAKIVGPMYILITTVYLVLNFIVFLYSLHLKRASRNEQVKLN